MLDRLESSRIGASLGADVLIGREIIVREETTSTSDCLWQLTRAGAAEGLVVFAEHQTGGRGQRGNRWESAAHKGLWFSLLLRPNIPLRESWQLTHWASSAIAHTINEHVGVETRIKPPNDVYIGERKIAGVLVEMRAQEKAPHVAIVGIGLNVNQRARDFSPQLRERVCSLAMVSGRRLDRNQLAVNLLQELDRSYIAFLRRRNRSASPDKQPARSLRV